MAIEYQLTLAGEASPEAVAARAVADPADRPAPIREVEALHADLADRYGFTLSVLAGRHGYYTAQADTGIWRWEPDAYVDVTFRMGKDPERYDEALRKVLGGVARLLATGGEDAAFVVNGDHVLLTRINGTVRKHQRAEWWDHYGFADDIIPA